MFILITLINIKYASDYFVNKISSYLCLTFAVSYAAHSLEMEDFSVIFQTSKVTAYSAQPFSAASDAPEKPINNEDFPFPPCLN